MTAPGHRSENRPCWLGREQTCSVGSTAARTQSVSTERTTRHSLDARQLLGVGAALGLDRHERQCWIENHSR